MNVKLYIEGGSKGSVAEAFRAGWSSFFVKAGLRRKPRVVVGEDRAKAFDLYRTALRSRAADELPLLLVDSEEVPAPGQSAWAHLDARDRWRQPEGAGMDDAYLMITCMETWFIADRESLRRFFGKGWKEKPLPAQRGLEKVPKKRIFDALKRASAGCAQPYTKGEPSLEILAEIRPAVVAAHCPAAARLLARLRNP